MTAERAGSAAGAARSPAGARAGDPARPAGGGVVRELVTAARPRQWVKNVLVLAAPAAAGVLPRPGVLADVAGAAACFVLASIAVYLGNDVADREEDAAHPDKRHRPIAAGRVSLRTALGVALAAAGAALGGGWLVDPALAGVLAIYLGLNVAYDLGLRDVPLLDLAVVASGFVLRALAGGAATGVAASKWFLIVVSFGALYVVICKRAAEVELFARPAAGATDAAVGVTDAAAGVTDAAAGAADGSVRAGPGGSRRRSVLDAYSPGLLRELRITTSAVAIGAYVLWAFQSARFVQGSFFELSIIPFVLGMFRYAMVADHDGARAPTEVFLADRWLQVAGVVWVVLFGLGVHVA